MFCFRELYLAVMWVCGKRQEGTLRSNQRGKFKDKKFAAKCDREVIRNGCEMLGMEVKDVAQICIDAMKVYADELQLGIK